MKGKLELARDLLRHSQPDGDLAGIVGRALDLLLDDVERRRFGRRRKASTGQEAVAPSSTEASSAIGAAPTRATSSQVSRAVRRAVRERDGLGCSWVDEDGMRCGSTAWLEFDHREPAGRGGRSHAGNVRLLCKAHNRLAAEQAYGREHVERCIEKRRAGSCPMPVSEVGEVGQLGLL